MKIISIKKLTGSQSFCGTVGHITVTIFKVYLTKLYSNSHTHASYEPGFTTLVIEQIRRMETAVLHFVIARYTKTNHKHNRREDTAEKL